MKKYAVLIGNSQFPDESDKAKLPDLACPVQDVDGLEKVLASERGEFDVLALKNEPSYKILRELQRKLKQATTDDLFLLYYSGHGKPNKSNILHLTTFDTVVAELATSAISMNRIYEILSEAKCRKIVIILDCCYSGAAGQGFKGAVDDQLQQLNNARGTYLVTASTELQVAHESAAEGLSLFTKHLIAGLETGEADKDGDGWVSMNELYDYVYSKVTEENANQQPTKHVSEERGGLLIAKSFKNSINKTNKEQMTIIEKFKVYLNSYDDWGYKDDIYFQKYFPEFTMKYMDEDSIFSGNENREWARGEIGYHYDTGNYTIPLGFFYHTTLIEKLLIIGFDGGKKIIVNPNWSPIGSGRIYYYLGNTIHYCYQKFLSNERKTDDSTQLRFSFKSGHKGSFSIPVFDDETELDEFISFAKVKIKINNFSVKPETNEDKQNTLFYNLLDIYNQFKQVRSNSDSVLRRM